MLAKDLNDSPQTAIQVPASHYYYVIVCNVPRKVGKGNFIAYKFILGYCVSMQLISCWINARNFSSMPQFSASPVALETSVLSSRFVMSFFPKV